MLFENFVKKIEKKINHRRLGKFVIILEFNKPTDRENIIFSKGNWKLLPEINLTFERLS